MESLQSQKATNVLMETVAKMRSMVWNELFLLAPVEDEVLVSKSGIQRGLLR